MIRRARRRDTAFTLVELAGVIVALGVLAAVAGPIVASAGDAYRKAETHREAIDAASFTLERILSLLRDGPDSPPGSGAIGLTLASPTAFAFTDGRRVELEGDVVWITVPGAPGGQARLCSGATRLAFAYLGADGVTDTSATPAATTRVEAVVEVGGVTLRSAAYLRATGRSP